MKKFLILLSATLCVFSFAAENLKSKVLFPVKWEKNASHAPLKLVENGKLKDAGIGTNILFQETYNKENYEELHPTGHKHDYAWRTEAMDRAMEGGIDDVGCGVLYGLTTCRYDKVISGELNRVPNDKVRGIAAEHIEKIKSGNRNFRFW